MNCVIPYTKEIVFKTKVAEISSISLEHEMSVNATELLGNFIVSGEYKAHELSVNKDEFSYTLPFSIELSDNVDTDTIDFSITDFSYEIVNENTLKVFIEFSVLASENEEVVVEETKDEIFQDVSTALENDVELSDVIIELPEENTRKEEITIPEVLENNERLSEKETMTIMDSINNENDEFAIYHIHIVKEAETIEMISSMYNSSIDLISEYNDLTNIGVGDKLIIPEDKDE